MRYAPLLALIFAACPGSSKKPRPPAEEYAWVRETIVGPKTTRVTSWTERTGITSTEFRATVPGEYKPRPPYPAGWWSAPQGQMRLLRIMNDMTEPRYERGQARVPHWVGEDMPVRLGR